MKFEPFVAYEASAGSGKTFQLTVRYLSLLFLDQSPQSILCVTFTKKAAAQMRERIIDSLTNLDTNMIELISYETGLSIEQILMKKNAIKDKFIESNSNILNIDKFFTKVLRSFSYEANLDPNFQIKSQLDKDKLIDNFFKKIINYDEFIELFLNQTDSLEGIISLFDTLYEIDPLLPQFTHNDKLQELESIAMELMDSLRSQILHCPDASDQVKGFMEFKTIEDIIQKPFFKKESLSEHRNFKKCFNEDLDAVFHSLKIALSNYLQAKERYLLSNLIYFYSLYKEARENKHTLQFNDITQKVFSLLYGIDKDFFYFRLDAHYKHILIDEFQDTSLLQFYIFKPMIDEIMSGVGQGDFRSFFYVGDVKQSIYRFRGGHKSLFYEITNLYNVQLNRMDKNYRSSSNVVNFVNQYFAFMKGFTPQKAIKEGGFVSVEFVDDESIMNNIESKIHQLLQKGYSVDDISILTFKNKDAQEIETFLRQKKYKISTENSSKLISNVKVASLLAGLRYLVYKEPIDKELFFYYTDSVHKEIKIDFHHSDHPFNLLFKLIEKYDHYDGDLNIIKLLELSLNYKDLLEFLDEMIDDNAINESGLGIKLMTIHKSKGLEFKNCIVVDMLGKQQSSRNKIIINNEGTAIESLNYKLKHRENFDKEYLSILNKEQSLQNEDLEHLLYVASTRAEKNLFLIAKEKDSKLNHLKLAPLHIGAIEEQKQMQIDTPVSSQTITYKAIMSQKSEKKPQEKTYSYEATLYGTALHYCMEQLESFTKVSLDHAIESTHNKFGNLVDTQNIYKRVHNLLQNSDFIQLCQGKIIKEKPLIDDGKNKQVDMLIQKERGYIVVDYKTSNKSQIKHIAQVKEYVAIISKLASVQCNGVIVYMLDDSVSVVEV